MIFSSAIFAAFFVIVFTIHWYIIPTLIPERYRLRTLHIFLLSASYFFYMHWDWRFGFLMAASTLLDYGIGRWLGIVDERTPRREDADQKRCRIIILSVIMNLGILAYFKYADFFIGSFIDFANTVVPGAVKDRNSLLTNVILPLGISFITFMSMSYTIDVYRRIIPVEKSFVKYALFVSFFPHLVAGPILVAKELLPQFNKMPEFSIERMRLAARWLALGFLKKAVIADNLAGIIDVIYRNPGSHGTAVHWVGAVGFWAQVYCDFSGYTDMAWGAALFLGYNLTENFRVPYASRSVTEHWQRWHISLIRWIRDYLYIPLGGNRVSFWRHKLNVFLTMFLAGLWHGANWTFILWGSIHGSILVAEATVQQMRGKKEEHGRVRPWWDSKGRVGATGVLTGARSAGGSIVRLLLTSFCTVYFGTMFRAANISDSVLILKRMIGLDYVDTPVQPSMWRPVLLGAVAVIIGHVLGYWIFEKRRLQFNPPAWVEVLLVPVVIVIFMQLAATDAVPFIYFVF